MKAYIMKPIKAYWASYAGLSKAAWLRTFLGLLNVMASGVFFYFSLYFVTELHFSVETAGLLISIYGIGTCLGGIVGGKLCDRISPHYVALISVVLQALGFLILTQAFNIAPLIGIIFLLGFSAYGFYTSNDVWILKNCADENVRMKAINILYTVSNLGIGLAALFVTLSDKNGFKSVFYLASFLLFLCAAVLLILGNTKQPIHTNTETLDEHQPNKKPLLAIIILSAVFLIGVIISLRTSMYLIYIRQTLPNLNMGAIGILFALNPILIVLLQTPLIHYLGSINKLKMVAAGSLLMGLGAWVLAWHPSYWLALLTTIIYTLGEMLFFTPAQFLVYESGHEKKKGQALGAFQSTYAASVILGPFLGGILYNQLGGNSVWLASGIFGIICFSVCLFYNRFRKKSLFSADTNTAA